MVVQDGFKINQHLSRAAVLKSCSAALPFSSHKWQEQTGKHFPPHFPSLGMKECQTWSWHVQLHQGVYVNRHQHVHQNDFFTMIKLRVSAILCLEYHPEVKVDFASFLKFPWCQSKPIALPVYIFGAYTQQQGHIWSHSVTLNISYVSGYRVNQTVSQGSLQWGWKKTSSSWVPFSDGFTG